MNYINILNKIIDENKKNEKTKENPYFVFTWGQAGAGKSNLIKIIKHNFKNENFIIIDADEYRKYHPNIKYIMRDTTTVVKKTGEFIREIERSLLDTYIKSKNNVIFVTSSKDYIEMSQLIDELLKYNYKIHVYGMITSFSEAFISTQERYELQLKMQKEIPRFVDFIFYKKSFLRYKRYTEKDNKR